MQNLVVLLAIVALAEPPVQAEPPTQAAEPQTARAATLAAEAAKLAAQAVQQAAAAVQALDPSGTPPPALVTGSSSAPAVRPPPLAPPGLSPWAAQLAVNVQSLTGNANLMTASLDGKLTGHWRDWNAEGHVTAAFGQNRATSTQDEAVTAQRAEVTLRGERTYDAVGTYLLGGIGTNRVTSIASRITAEAGASLIWWEEIRPDFVRTRLRTDLGLRGIREARYAYFPEPARAADPSLVIVYGPILRVTWRFGINRNAFFTEEADVLQDLTQERDIRFNTTSRLTAQLYESLALQFTFKLNYIGVPAPGKQKQDTELSSGLTWTW